MQGATELSKERNVREFWMRSCGFIDLTLGELYAYICELLARYHWPYERVISDVELSLTGDSRGVRRVLTLGKVDNPSWNCYLVGGDRSNQLSDKHVRLGDFEFRVWDSEKLSTIFQANTFDMVLSVHSLREFDVDIREFFRLLKPSGQLIIIEPLPCFRRRIPELTSDECHKQGNNHCLDEILLISKLESTGFRVDEIILSPSQDSELLAYAMKPRYYSKMKGFRFLKAEIRADLERVWSLLYQVYCMELGVEQSDRSGLLRDAYDEYATHLLAVDENDKPVGTLRIVPKNPKGFPMDSDFPLTKYMESRGIANGVEGGRFVISKDINYESRSIVAFGLFKCLFDYCREMNVNDVFTTTMLKIVQKYDMPGFERIGEPFRYAEPLSAVLWVPMHCDISMAYKNYLRNAWQNSETL